MFRDLKKLLVLCFIYLIVHSLQQILNIFLNQNVADALLNKLNYYNYTV